MVGNVEGSEVQSLETVSSPAAWRVWKDFFFFFLWDLLILNDTDELWLVFSITAACEGGPWALK